MIIGYDTIIFQYMVVQLGIIADFKHNLFERYISSLTMKQLGFQALCMCKPNPVKHEILGVVINTA